MKFLPHPSHLIYMFTILFPFVSFAQAPITADSYLYLSQIERVFNGDMEEEYLWTFLNGDTCNGEVRSNDFIYIHERPIFFERVYTSQDSFMEHSANPAFWYEPLFSVPQFEFDFDLAAIGEIALEQGNYIGDNQDTWNTLLSGNQYGWHIVQWERGTSLLPETIVYEANIPYDDDQVIFVEGPLYIKGEHVRGGTTIVCDEKVFITDNLVYDGTIIGEDIIIPEDTTAVLGIIAENDILIANTPENGMENGLNQGEFSDHSNKHCVITASLVSLNGSFSFENKNFDTDSERFDSYYFCDPEGPHAGETDRRGTIYLLGSLAFHRRDYIRTSNCGTTGYDKHYRYDSRLDELTPPLFDTALSVNWGSNEPSSIPVTHKLEKPYPNPFNSSINLNMILVKRDQVKIKILNVLGQEIYNQNYGWMNQGSHRVEITLENKPAGLYFLQVSTSNGFMETQKILYIK